MRIGKPISGPRQLGSGTRTIEIPRLDIPKGLVKKPTLPGNGDRVPPGLGRKFGGGLDLPRGILGGGGGGGYGAHLYWRVFFFNNQTNANSYINLQEVELRSTPGGPSVATGGTATASSTAFGSASLAFNYTSGTYWHSATTTNEWLQYEFAAPTEIVEVALIHNGSDIHLRAPRQCKLQYSDDGVNFTDAFSFTWVAPVKNVQRAFPQAPLAAGFAHAWRINVTANNGDSFTYISELQLRATIGGADQCPAVGANDGSSAGRAVGNSGTPQLIFDNSTGTHWGNVNSLPRWAGIVLPTPIEVAEIAISNLSTVNRSPRDFTLDYLDPEGDGLTWVTQATWTGETWTSVVQTKVLTA